MPSRDYSISTYYPITNTTTYADIPWTRITADMDIWSYELYFKKRCAEDIPWATIFDGTTTVKCDECLNSIRASVLRKNADMDAEGRAERNGPRFKFWKEGWWTGIAAEIKELANDPTWSCPHSSEETYFVDAIRIGVKNLLQALEIEPITNDKQSIGKVSQLAPKFIRLRDTVRDVDNIEATECLSLMFKNTEYELGMFFLDKDINRMCEIVGVSYIHKEGVVLLTCNSYDTKYLKKYKGYVITLDDKRSMRLMTKEVLSVGSNTGFNFERVCLDVHDNKALCVVVEP